MSDQNKPPKFRLVPGKVNKVQVNVPMTFVIRTTGGTTITGLITPNNPLSVTPGDDIAEYRLELNKEILGKPKPVK